VVSEQGKYLRYGKELFQLSEAFERLFFFLFITFIIVHVYACMWILIAIEMESDVNGTGTWIDKYNFA